MADDKNHSNVISIKINETKPGDRLRLIAQKMDSNPSRFENVVIISCNKELKEVDWEWAGTCGLLQFTALIEFVKFAMLDTYTDSIGE